MDPDPAPDPHFFVSDLQDGNKKYLFLKRFFASYFLKVNSNHFSKMKSYKKVTNQEESRFFLLFCLMMKDLDPDLDPYRYL
jgi:hypothetical protein